MCHAYDLSFDTIVAARYAWIRLGDPEAGKGGEGRAGAESLPGTSFTGLSSQEDPAVRRITGG